MVGRAGPVGLAMVAHRVHALGGEGQADDAAGDKKLRSARTTNSPVSAAAGAHRGPVRAAVG